MKYICKIANIDEIKEKWDYEINNTIDKYNWKIWKEKNIDNFLKGYIIPYYGILDGIIISEATVVLESSIIQNLDDLISKDKVYLSAFRTIKEYQNQGYFSKLFKYMINDLKEKGYKKAIIGVEANDIKNKEIYSKYGFNKYIKTAIENYPDGTEIIVEYYEKIL